MRVHGLHIHSICFQKGNLTCLRILLIFLENPFFYHVFNFVRVHEMLLDISYRILDTKDISVLTNPLKCDNDEKRRINGVRTPVPKPYKTRYQWQWSAAKERKFSSVLS